MHQYDAVSIYDKVSQRPGIYDKSYQPAILLAVFLLSFFSVQEASTTHFRSTWISAKPVAMFDLKTFLPVDRLLSHIFLHRYYNQRAICR